MRELVCAEREKMSTSRALEILSWRASLSKFNKTNQEHVAFHKKHFITIGVTNNSPKTHITIDDNCICIHLEGIEGGRVHLKTFSSTKKEKKGRKVLSS